MMMESNLTLLTDRRTSTVNILTTTDYWCFSFSGERDQDYNNNDKKKQYDQMGEERESSQRYRSQVQMDTGTRQR